MTTLDQRTIDRINASLQCSQVFKLGDWVDEVNKFQTLISTTIFVDSAAGLDSNDGLFGWDNAVKTITQAVAIASDGWTIMMRGTFTEAVTCSKSLAFVGAGNTVNNCIWMEAAVPGITLMTLTANNCLFDNIRFRIPTTAGIGINMNSTDYTIVQNCHFQGRSGSYYAIYNNGGSQCQILNNVFEYMNTATFGCAIFGYSTTEIPTGWIISGNIFHSNLRHIYMTMRQSQIFNNIFQNVGLSATNTSLTATVILDLNSQTTGGQFNTVTKNSFQGASYSISGGFVAATGDNWYGNKSSYISQTGVTAEGTTTNVPS